MGRLVLLAVVMWVLQTILGLWQFNRFNRHLKLLRSEGKVAIGKAKGRFLAGVVVMFVIDGDTKIIRGEVLKGRTVFADFKPLNELNGLKLTEIDEGCCEKFSRNVKEAVLSARRDYENYRELKEEGSEKVEPLAA